MKRLSLLIIEIIFSGNILYAQTDSVLYSFFIAGHTYGEPGVNNIGLHPPFKQKFGYIKNRTEINFGVFTGDIVIYSTTQDWDEVDADIDSLGLPVYFAAGNHDLSDRLLYESRYGNTYYYFLFQNDLFVVLDPNIDEWNISGVQLDFLINTINNYYLEVDNIFVFFHQILWWDANNIYSAYSPNSLYGRADSINFWTDIEPVFHQLPNNIVFCAGDIGAGSWNPDFMYDSYDNISFVGSGMGEGQGDNFIVINVLENKTISYDLICLNDSNLHCFGELTDYQISSQNIPNSELFNASVKIYPNPSIGTLIIEYDEKFTGQTNVQIFNSSGQLILENHKENDADNKQIIDLSGFNKGLYLLTIKHDLITFQMTKIVIY